MGPLVVAFYFFGFPAIAAWLIESRSELKSYVASSVEQMSGTSRKVWFQEVYAGAMGLQVILEYSIDMSATL